MAVSLTSFSPTAQLAFLAIGPIVDVKLMAMEAGPLVLGSLNGSSRWQRAAASSQQSSLVLSSFPHSQPALMTTTGTNQ